MENVPLVEFLKEPLVRRLVMGGIPVCTERHPPSPGANDPMLNISLQHKMMMKLSPQQVQYLKMLQLPTLALEQKIKAELEMNPLLEEGYEEELEAQQTVNRRRKSRSKKPLREGRRESRRRGQEVLH